MNIYSKTMAGVLVVLIAVFGVYVSSRAIYAIVRAGRGGGCFTGAFIGDNPTRADILSFEETYGKAPYYVLLFTDWERYPDGLVIKDILGQGSCPIITWEPWIDHSKPIDIEELLQGGYDEYLLEFAERIGSFDGEILIRFAHEMNGDWYPWAGSIIGAENYRDMYRYVKGIFDDRGIKNVKWVFSFNWENVPGDKDNDISNYYPGSDHVDYIGIDGYNWGTTQTWSRWMSFRDLFLAAYKRSVYEFKKPVIISEFSSAKEGGDKAEWIRQAMSDIKSWRKVKGFVLFNVNKEVDWTFPISESWGRGFRKSISAPYFIEKAEDDR